MENQEVDFSRCINCYNCFTICPEEGIVYRGLQRRIAPSEPKNSDNSRRIFLVTTLTGVAGLMSFQDGGISVQPAKSTTIPEKKKYSVCPPGSKGQDHFTGICTACHLCVSTCPTQVLQPSFTQYGIFGILQPHMDYHTGFCNFDCIVCTQICPSGAILPLTVENKKTVQIGIVKFILKSCVVYTDHTACGACSEHCPTKAVFMAPYKESLSIPTLNTSICVGCGACEHACPTTPYKAIYVEGNPVHLKAKKPESKPEEQKKETQGDFPF
jgi:formate hydrogenlyase subunit 6/NADH:ubiquinone oxidoreductase subunit I